MIRPSLGRRRAPDSEHPVVHRESESAVRPVPVLRPDAETPDVRLEDVDGSGGVKRVRLRYDGECPCGTAVSAGTLAGYDRAAKRVVCPRCLETVVAPWPSEQELAGPVVPEVEARAVHEPAEAELDRGRPGGSARAAYERRVARREERVRSRHPRLGGLLLALTSEPQSTRAWESGAVGEERVGARLNALAADGVLVLHDRRIPGSRANIDHVAIGPRGVFVIDAKRYVGAKVEVRRSGGLWRPAQERLLVAGRDRTHLVAGLARQVAAVHEALEGLPQLDGVAVQPVLAFVEADLPLLGALTIAGVPILRPRGTAKLVRQPGPLTLDQRARLYEHLAVALPAYPR